MVRGDWFCLQSEIVMVVEVVVAGTIFEVVVVVFLINVMAAVFLFVVLLLF